MDWAHRSGSVLLHRSQKIFNQGKGLQEPTFSDQGLNLLRRLETEQSGIDELHSSRYSRIYTTE
jgi:hypothetical protein